METLTVTTDISTCEVFALTGPAKIKADDLPDGATVTIYEERVDGGYDPARASGVQIMLKNTQASLIIEGYGNYKCLGSEAGLVVGYES
jgi:hypothetical protein